MPFADYHYYENIAAYGSYTPPAKTISSVFNAKGILITAEPQPTIMFWDGGGWVYVQDVTGREASTLICQDNAQNVRFRNGNSTTKISLTGVTWS